MMILVFFTVSDDNAMIFRDLLPSLNHVMDKDDKYNCSVDFAKGHDITGKLDRRVNVRTQVTEFNGIELTQNIKVKFSMSMMCS